jgi:hypothetical protein
MTTSAPERYTLSDVNSGYFVSWLSTFPKSRALPTELPNSLDVHSELPNSCDALNNDLLLDCQSDMASNHARPMTFSQPHFNMMSHSTHNGSLSTPSKIQHSVHSALVLQLSERITSTQMELEFHLSRHSPSIMTSLIPILDQRSEQFLLYWNSRAYGLTLLLQYLLDAQVEAELSAPYDDDDSRYSDFGGNFVPAPQKSLYKMTPEYQRLYDSITGFSLSPPSTPEMLKHKPLSPRKFKDNRLVYKKLSNLYVPRGYGKKDDDPIPLSPEPLLSKEERRTMTKAERRSAKQTRKQDRLKTVTPIPLDQTAFPPLSNAVVEIAQSQTPALLNYRSALLSPAPVRSPPPPPPVTALLPTYPMNPLLIQIRDDVVYTDATYSEAYIGEPYFDNKVVTPYTNTHPSLYVGLFSSTILDYNLLYNRQFRAQMFASGLQSIKKALIGEEMEKAEEIKIAVENSTSEVAALRSFLESFFKTGQDGRNISFDALFASILTIYTASRANSVIDVALILTSALLHSGILSISRHYNRIHEAIFTLLSPWAPDNPAVGLVAHSGALLGATTSIVAYVMVPFILSKLSGRSDKPHELEATFQAQFLRSAALSSWSKLLGSAKTIISSLGYFAKLFWWVSAWIYNKVTGCPLVLDEDNTALVGDATDWMKRVYMQCKTPVISTITAQRAQDLVLLADEGFDIEVRLTEIGYTKNNFTAFFSLYKEIRELAASCKLHLEQMDQRIVPVLVAFLGAPSDGKSTLFKIMFPHLWYYLQTGIYHIPPNDVQPFTQNLVYTKPKTSEYWEGYNEGKQFVVLDDWDANTDKQLCTSLAEQIIEMVNTAPMALNVAFEGKGKVYFNSPVIIQTSNNLAPPQTSNFNLRDITAYSGRRDFVFKVEIKKEYKVQNPINKRQTISTRSDEPFTTECYTFTLLDSLTHAEIQKDMTYESVLKLICGRLLKKSLGQNDVTTWAKRHMPSQQFYDSIKAQMERTETKAEKKKRKQIERLKAQREEDDLKMRLGYPQELVAEDAARAIGEKLDVQQDSAQETSKSEKLDSPQDRGKEISDDLSKLSSSNAKLREMLSSSPLVQADVLSPGDKLRLGQQVTPTKSDIKCFEAIQSLAEKYNLMPFVQVKEALKTEDEKAKERRQTWKTIIVSIGGLIALSVAGLTAWYTAKDYFSAQWGTGASQGRMTLDSRRREGRSGKFTKMRYQSQNTLDVMHSIVAKNAAIVSFSDDSGVNRQRLTFVVDNYFMAPAHFFDWMDKHDVHTLTLLSNRHKKPRLVSVSDIHRVCNYDRDLVIGRILGEQPYPDIRKHLIKRELLGIIDFSRVCVANVNFDNISQVLKADAIVTDARFASTQTYEGPDNENIHIYNTVIYSGDYKPGHCGNPVFLDSNLEHAVLIGHHVAGARKLGMAAVITVEDVEEGMVLLQDFQAQCEKGEPTFKYKSWQFKGKAPHKVHMPTRTQLVPTPFAGVLQEPKMAPARLKPFKDAEGNVVSPIQVGIAAMEFGPYKPWDKQLLHEIAEEQLAHMTHTYPARKIPLEDCVNGVANASFIKRVDSKTSCGYMDKPPELTKKSQYLKKIYQDISRDIWYYELTEELKERIKMRTQELLERKCTMKAVMHLKDELRDLEKVYAGKTRLFSAMPLEHLILCKRYLGALLENMGRHPFDYGVAVGLDPLSPDWAQIYDLAKQVNADMELAGDVRKYDASEIKEVIDEVIWIYDEWYRLHDVDWCEEDRIIRAELEKLGSYEAEVIIVDDLVKPGRLAITGRNTTYATNSLGCIIKHYYMFITHCRRNGIIMSAHDARKVMSIIAGGDDFLLFTSKKYGYTFEAMVALFAEFGMEMTSPDKSSSTISTEIGSNDFLKRKPRVEIIQGIPWTFAPLPKERIFEILNWQQRSLPFDVAWENSGNNVLLEMVHYGEDEFNSVKTTLNEYACKFNLARFTETWKGIMSKHCGFNFFRSQMYKSYHALATSWADLYYKEFNQLPKYTTVPKEAGFHTYFSNADGLYEGYATSKKQSLENAIMHFYSEHRPNIHPLFVTMQINNNHRVTEPTTPANKCSTLTSLSDRFYGEYNTVPNCVYHVHGPDHLREWRCTLTASGMNYNATASTKAEARELCLAQFYQIPNFKAQSGNDLSSDQDTEVDEPSLEMDLLSLTTHTPNHCYDTVEDVPLIPGEYFIGRYAHLNHGCYRKWEVSGGRSTRRYGTTKCKMYTCTIDTAVTKNIDTKKYVQMIVRSRTSFTPAIKPPPIIVPDEETISLLRTVDLTWREYAATTKGKWICSDCSKVSASTRKACPSCDEFPLADTACSSFRYDAESTSFLPVFISAPVKFVAQMEKEIVQGEQVDAVVTTTQLTTVSDSTVPAIPRSKFVKIYDVNDDPYPYQGLTPILERQHKIGSVTLAGSTPAGTLIALFNFPYSVTNGSPVLLDKLVGFSDVRAGFCCKVLTNATVFHAAQLLIATIPTNGALDQVTADARLQNIYAASSCNAQIMSIGTDRSIEVHQPYIAPIPYIHTNLLSNPYAYAGTLAVYVLSPLVLTNDTAVPTVDLIFYANLEDVQVAGPILRSSLFKAQMGKEAVKKSVKGIVSGVAEDAASTLIDTITNALPSPASAVKAAMSIAPMMLGLDKPISLEAPRWTMPTASPALSEGEGLSNRHILTVTHKNGLANDPSSFGRTDDEQSINAIAAKPGLFAFGSYDASAAEGTVIAKWHCNPCTAHTLQQTSDSHYFSYHTPVSMVSQMFKQYRGTMKYMMKISQSKMSSQRLLYTWWPNYDDIPAVGDMLIDAMGDIVNYTYDFTGDGTMLWSVPYFSHFSYCETAPTWSKSSDRDSGAMCVSIVNPVITMNSASATTVGYSLWCAADLDDMQFLRVGVPPQSTTTKVNSVVPGAGTVIAQAGSFSQSVDDIFSAKFPPLVPAKSFSSVTPFTPETVGDIYTLMHRMHSFRRITVPLLTPDRAVYFDPMREFANTVNNPSPFMYFWKYFMFFRGSFDINLIWDDSQAPNGFLNTELVLPTGSATYEPVTATGIVPTYFGGNGVAIENVALRSAHSINLPYYSRFMFQETRPLLTPAFGTTGFCYWLSGTSVASAPLMRLFIAPGDDFRFAWGCGAPLVEYITGT